LGIETISNGIVNKRWTLPKKGDSIHDYVGTAGGATANGAANGFLTNGAGPKKQL
jgi:hypothetical protein